MLCLNLILHTDLKDMHQVSGQQALILLFKPEKESVGKVRKLSLRECTETAREMLNTGIVLKVLVLL